MEKGPKRILRSVKKLLRIENACTIRFEKKKEKMVKNKSGKQDLASASQRKKLHL